MQASLLPTQAPISGRVAQRARPMAVRAQAEVSRPSTPSASSGKADSSSTKSVTIEYQRAQAKEMVAYFKAQAEDELIKKSQVFGWTSANEITNGRWVMMGFAIGLLTEYATGVDFPNQLKLMLSYLGIVDMYD